MERRTEEAVLEATPPPITMKSLLEAGVHFGHQRRRWNPKMQTYIFAHRNGIHIIDLQKTLRMLEQAREFMADVAAQGRKVLMVGTKKQAQDTILSEATRSGAFHITTRWLGGTLTNFKTIQSRIDYLVQLEARQAKGDLDLLVKKESMKLQDTMARLNRYLGGIKEMTEMPGVLFVIDVGKEAIAVAEARRVGVPVVALVDSDCDPGLVEHPIPGNDDAIRSIRLITARIADAIIDGNNRRIAMLADEMDQEEFEEEPSQPVAIESAVRAMEPASATPTVAEAMLRETGGKLSTAVASPSEAPTAEASPSEAATTEASPSEAPTAEASPSEAPTAEASPSEAPTAEASPSEAPTAEASPSEAPTAEEAGPVSPGEDGNQVVPATSRST